MLFFVCVIVLRPIIQIYSCHGPRSRDTVDHDWARSSNNFETTSIGHPEVSYHVAWTGPGVKDQWLVTGLCRWWKTIYLCSLLLWTQPGNQTVIAHLHSPLISRRNTFHYRHDGLLATVHVSNPIYLGISKNRGTPNWMVYNGKPY